MMVHNVSSLQNGDYHDMDKMSEILQQANKAICNAYMSKSGMSEKEVLEMMDKTTWLTAQNSVDKKLIDEVMFENMQLVASFRSSTLPKALIDKAKEEFANQKQSKLQAQTKLNILKLKGVTQ
jgi:hypothetical protein